MHHFCRELPTDCSDSEVSRRPVRIFCLTPLAALAVVHDATARLRTRARCVVLLEHAPGSVAGGPTPLLTRSATVAANFFPWMYNGYEKIF